MLVNIAAWRPLAYVGLYACTINAMLGNLLACHVLYVRGGGPGARDRARAHARLPRRAQNVAVDRLLPVLAPFGVKWRGEPARAVAAGALVAAIIVLSRGVPPPPHPPATPLLSIPHARSTTRVRDAPVVMGRCAWARARAGSLNAAAQLVTGTFGAFCALTNSACFYLDFSE